MTGVGRDAATDSAAVITNEIIFQAL
jgi:hypothetical protein